MTKNEVHFSDFHNLEIPYRVIEGSKYAVLYQFYTICKAYKPQLIHTWGRVQTLYSLPAVVLQKIPLVNSQITSAPPKISKWSISRAIDKVNFYFSNVVLANSIAGAETFKPPLKKRKVIYNGINMARFYNLPDVEWIKRKYCIATPYTIVMSASFSPNKNYDLFYRVASLVTERRNDITFIGVGESHDDAKFSKLLALTQANPQILLPGRIDDVEALVNACDIGVLFSMNGEGISNSIMEYMALSKPVIANEAGGTKELVRHNLNGYLISSQTDEEIAGLILDLINDTTKRKRYGEKSREIIDEEFSLEKMGKAFEEVFRQVLTQPLNRTQSVQSNRINSTISL